MIEMPEAATISRQMNTELCGKTIARFGRGNLVHKFLWLNRPDEEYQSILTGRTIRAASSYGKSIYVYLGEEYLLWFGETGGRILYHPAGQELPGKFHLVWDFTDDSHLTFTMQMWGFLRLLDRSEFGERPNTEVGIPPLSPGFTFERFDQMLEIYPDKTRKGVKGFLVTSVHVNGLGNAYVQDVLFRAGLDPRRKIPSIAPDERRRLYDAIQEIVARATELGGRDEETDLFGQPGCYVRLMDKRTVGKPCPNCQRPIQKIAYLGGACYLCPKCQQ